MRGRERHQSLRNYQLANQVIKYYSTTRNRLNCCSPEDVPINATCEAGHKALPDRGPVPQEVRKHWQVTEVDCRFLFGSKHGFFRFGSIPDLIELDHLTVSGDVTFGRGVSQFLNICIQVRHFSPASQPVPALNLLYKIELLDIG